MPRRAYQRPSDEAIEAAREIFAKLKFKTQPFEPPGGRTFELVDPSQPLAITLSRSQWLALVEFVVESVPRKRGRPRSRKANAEHAKLAQYVVLAMEKLDESAAITAVAKRLRVARNTVKRHYETYGEGARSFTLLRRKLAELGQQ